MLDISVAIQREATCFKFGIYYLRVWVIARNLTAHSVAHNYYITDFSQYEQVSGKFHVR
jgi:hypothetical protein